MAEKFILSTLGKTWIMDLDGTVIKHNGYKLDGHDTLLPGAARFFQSLSKDDAVVFITSRGKENMAITEAFLKENDIRYTAIVYGAPYGERILVNDKKPSGIRMAIAVNTERDSFMEAVFETDPKL